MMIPPMSGPLMTRKSLDERFHKISGGKAGTITSVVGEGALATVRWDVTPSEEHQYRTGRFGRFELVCKRTLNIQRRDDDTILRTLLQCMTAPCAFVWSDTSAVGIKHVCVRACAHMRVRPR